MYPPASAFKIFFFSICLFYFNTSLAQKSSTGQFWNEYGFTENLNSKLSLELNFGDTWTGTPIHTSPFSSLAQIYTRAWIHYNFNERWKFSAFYAYYFNRNVPEIEQRKAPEWRSAIQATYFIYKGRSIISTRFRLEDRHIKNPDTIYEAVHRVRGQIKLTYPINKPLLTKGAIYAIVSDELFFKTASKISGPDFFDRNRFTAGLGYLFTKNFQLEVTYANEWLPRGSSPQLYNAFQVNLTFNNFLASHLVSMFKRPKEIQESNHQ